MMNLGEQNHIFCYSKSDITRRTEITKVVTLYNVSLIGILMETVMVTNTQYRKGHKGRLKNHPVLVIFGFEQLKLTGCHFCHRFRGESTITKV